MKMADVVELLADLCVRGEAGPQGVAFKWHFDRSNIPRTGTVKFRIERGSGIAGRGDAWGVVELPSGPSAPKTRSKRELRQQILAAIAEGEKPADRVGYETYARWHTHGLTSSVQWFQRRKRGTR